jgi:hypothetical protein
VTSLVTKVAQWLKEVTQWLKEVTWDRRLVNSWFRYNLLSDPLQVPAM